MRTETTYIAFDGTRFIDEITYIAYDGTKFEDKETCKEYEKTILLDRLSSDCIFLDSDQKPVSIEEFIDDPEKVCGFYTPNEEQSKIIHQFLDESEINSPWHQFPHGCCPSGFYWCVHDDDWENVLDNFHYWEKLYNSFQEA